MTLHPSCAMCAGLVVTGAPPATNAWVTGLTAGTSYEFSVRAGNALGLGNVTTRLPD